MCVRQYPGRIEASREHALGNIGEQGARVEGAVSAQTAAHSESESLREGVDVGVNPGHSFSRVAFSEAYSPAT